ncbi:hypothetical protein D3C79_979390 [compost metagenome]
MRWRAIKSLVIDLLVLLVDEHHCVIAQAETASTVFIDPAAHAEAVRREAACLLVTPAPDAASTVGRAKFIPEQALGAGFEFGEIGAGGDSLRGTEFTRGQ